MAPTAPGRSRLLALWTVHSLVWLVVANAVGLLLAALLLWPGLGDLLAPLSYGRWLPLHLDLHLYGWCSLPLAALLLHWYLPPGEPGRLPQLALGAWSGTLLWGAVSWLAGRTSGKAFLEWSGVARLLLAATLLFFWLTLALSFGRAASRSWQMASAARRVTLARGLLLAALLAVPGLLFWAASPGVYPAINPDSGGATGTSLLGSTLGVVALLVALPYLLRLPAATGAGTGRTAALLLALHGIVFALLGHGDRSHHELAQILGLASLGIWPPLLGRHLRRFAWPRASRAWLAAVAGWGLVLLLSGVVAFFPGVLERWKFTNALVAHAHFAMAGLLTSLNVVLLTVVNAGGPLADLFAGRRPFLLWHGGTVLLTLPLLVLGTQEGIRPGLLYHGETLVTVLYAGRFLGGLVLLTASLDWLVRASRHSWRPIHDAQLDFSLLPSGRRL